jgi:hypothetical protein
VLGGRSMGFSPCRYPRIQLFVNRAIGKRPFRPESQTHARYKPNTRRNGLLARASFVVDDKASARVVLRVQAPPVASHRRKLKGVVAGRYRAGARWSQGSAPWEGEAPAEPKEVVSSE